MTKTANYNIPTPSLSDLADITKIASAINKIDSVIKSESTARQNADKDLQQYITEQISDISQSAILNDGNCTINITIPATFKTYADYSKSCYVVKADSPVKMQINEYQVNFDINFESDFKQDDTAEPEQKEVRYFYLTKNGVFWGTEEATSYVDLNTFDFKVALVNVEFTYDIDYGWLPPGDLTLDVVEEAQGEGSKSFLCKINRENILNSMILNLLANSQSQSAVNDSMASNLMLMNNRILNIEAKLDEIAAPTESSVVYVKNSQI